MHARLSPILVLAAGMGLAITSTVRAQAPTIQVQGRIQVQYRLSSGDSSLNYNTTGVGSNNVSNVFEVRRLRIQSNVRFGDNINLVIQPSFEMGALRMRDAYLRVGMSPRFGVTIGQEKSPFQRYELNSSNNLPSIERGLRVLRLAGKEGLNDLLVNNGYGSHDLGAFVDYVGPDNKVTVKAGVQSGSRESATDVNNAKSFYGRATATVITNTDNQPVLQVGASFASRDRAICQTVPAAAPTTCTAYFADSSKQTTAFGLDAEWGGFRPGFHVFADFAAGDNVPIALRKATGRNTGNLDSASTPITKFMGVSLVGAYRINTTGADTRLVKIFEPALRVDYLDPDTDSGDNEGMLITPVLNVYFANTTVLRAGYDFYSYKDATGTSRSAGEFKISWQANF